MFLLCVFGGVLVVVFLWWCSCGGVFVVVFLWCCKMCAGFRSPPLRLPFSHQIIIWFS